MQLNNYKIVLSVVFSGVRVTWSLVLWLCVCFVDRCLSFNNFNIKGLLRYHWAFSYKSGKYLPNAKEYSKQVTTMSKTNCIGLGEEFEDTKASVVDRGFEPWSDHTKDYKIGICWFSAKHAALLRKSEYRLALSKNNVSEWSDMSIRRLLFQWASTTKISRLVICVTDNQTSSESKISPGNSIIHLF
jgi:hypothetical protein